jgi:hypothetical protein
MRLPFCIGRHVAAVKLALTAMGMAMLVASCGAPGGGGGGPGGAGFTDSTGAVKVAVLLPVTS